MLTSVDGIEGDEDLPLYSTVEAAQRGLVIGPAAAFLCSDEARYVTGQTLIVSGVRYTAL